MHLAMVHLDPHDPHKTIFNIGLKGSLQTASNQDVGLLPVAQCDSFGRRPFEWFDAYLMGVRGLYTLATEQQDLWRRMRGDEWPVLVVDGGSFRYEMCRNFYFGSRHGGDLWSLQHALEEFLCQLMEWGWELIFVFDGISPEWKEATWRQRTEADYVRADRDARGVAEWEDCLPPIFSGLVLSATLLKLGVATVQADEDADGAVVGIAREKNGMVVSRDSDLMLMDSSGYIDMPQFFEFGLRREDPRGPKKLTSIDPTVFHPTGPSPLIPLFSVSKNGCFCFHSCHAYGICKMFNMDVNGCGSKTLLNSASS